LFNATDAVGCKLSSDKLSRIAGGNAIAKLGHVGDERRTNNHHVVLSEAKDLYVEVKYRSFASLRTTSCAQDDIMCPPFRPESAQVSRCCSVKEISESLSLASLQLTASSALASGLIASSLLLGQLGHPFWPIWVSNRSST
jgi:hypothetical protein